MIDLREIRETIEEIRRHGTTVGQAEKLALLYIAADYIEREDAESAHAPMESGYARASEPDAVDVEPRSEFLTACDGARIEDVLAVLDEHMEAIRVLYPKEYEAMVRRIERTKKALR